MSIYLFIFIVGVVVITVNGVYSDLKIRIWYNPSYARRGPFSATESLTLLLSCDDTLRLLATAMSQVGGRKIHKGEDGEYLTGWIGSFITNLAFHTEYQILASLRQETETVMVTCQARPRLMRGLVGIIGADRSGKYVDQLVQEIRLLAMPLSP